MKDIDFTIEKTTVSENIVAIMIRVENSEKKYYSFSIDKRRFDSMNEEQLELEIYNIAKKRVIDTSFDDEKLKEKAERVKTSIANYNKEKLNK